MASSLAPITYPLSLTDIALSRDLWGDGRQEGFITTTHYLPKVGHSLEVGQSNKTNKVFPILTWLRWKRREDTLHSP